MIKSGMVIGVLGKKGSYEKYNGIAPLKGILVK